MDSQDYQTFENHLDNAQENLKEILYHVKLYEIDKNEQHTLYEIIKLTKEIELEIFKKK